jgi:hypothetical protein
MNIHTANSIFNIRSGCSDLSDVHCTVLVLSNEKSLSPVAARIIMIHGDEFDKKNVNARKGVYKFACRNGEERLSIGIIGKQWEEKYRIGRQ